MSHVNFASFIPRIQRQVAPEFSSCQTTVDSINGFVDLVCENIVNVVNALNRKATVDAKTIQTAVQALLPGTLAKFAISEATAKVVNYTKNSLEKSGAPESVVAVTPGEVDVKSEEKDKESTDGKGDKKKASVGTRSTRSLKAGLTLPISRIDNYLKRFSQRVSPTAAVFLTAVLEFLVKEVVESAAEVTSSRKRKQIQTVDVNKAIWGDRTFPQQPNKKSSKETVTCGGDVELQLLAKKVKYSSALSQGWKGVYTSTSHKRRKVAHDEGDHAKAGAVTVDSSVVSAPVASVPVVSVPVVVA